MYPHLTLTAKQTASFWAKVDKRSEEECWFWIAARNRQGYGRFLERPAHRLSWSLVNGPIPEGLIICHSCDNPPCVNPSHLWADTPLGNFRDMVKKGRADANTLQRLYEGHRKRKAQEKAYKSAVMAIEALDAARDLRNLAQRERQERDAQREAVKASSQRERRKARKEAKRFKKNAYVTAKIDERILETNQALQLDRAFRLALLAEP